MSNILKLSEATALAFHSMAILAETPDKMFSVKDISSKIKCSEAHLSKVFQRIAKEGIIKSIRGPKGGFILIKDKKNITLLNIYEAIEGPFQINECLFITPSCGRTECILKGLPKTLGAELKAYLKKTTLADLVKKRGA